MSRLRPLLPLLGLMLSLGGCVGTDNLRLSRLWDDNRPQTDASKTVPPTQYYCYRNLGGVDCYVAPDPQRRQ